MGRQTRPCDRQTRAVRTDDPAGPRPCTAGTRAWGLCSLGSPMLGHPGSAWRFGVLGAALTGGAPIARQLPRLRRVYGSSPAGFKGPAQPGPGGVWGPVCRRCVCAAGGTGAMREIVHLQAGQCGNQIGAKVSPGPGPRRTSPPSRDRAPGNPPPPARIGAPGLPPQSPPARIGTPGTPLSRPLLPQLKLLPPPHSGIWVHKPPPSPPHPTPPPTQNSSNQD